MKISGIPFRRRNKALLLFLHQAIPQGNPSCFHKIFPHQPAQENQPVIIVFAKAAERYGEQIPYIRYPLSAGEGYILLSYIRRIVFRRRGISLRSPITPPAAFGKHSCRLPSASLLPCRSYPFVIPLPIHIPKIRASQSIETYHSQQHSKNDQRYPAAYLRKNLFYLKSYHRHPPRFSQSSTGTRPPDSVRLPPHCRKACFRTVYSKAIRSLRF